MEYYIEDFTVSNYQRLVRIAKSNNKICNFMEALSIDRGIIFRHDIDYSVHRAYALSKIEKLEGIQSTYFVRLHSPFYNVMETKITELLRKISDNGGIIGLHFEPNYYHLKVEDFEILNQKIVFEKKILEEILGINVEYISFHQPDVGANWYEIDCLWLGGGMLNVYGKFYKENFEYCSDSNGYWRFERLEDVLLDSPGKKIQVLTHPVWWQKEPMVPFERVRRCAEGRAASALRLYDESMANSGRLNIKT